MRNSPHESGPQGADARPLLLIDIDGVISLFGFPPNAGLGGPMDRLEPSSGRPEPSPGRPERSSDPPDGSPGRPQGAFHTIDGIPHFLSSTAAGHLRELVSVYDPVWCSGWEEKAEVY